MEEFLATTSSKTDPPEIAPAFTFFDGTGLPFQTNLGVSK